MNQRNEHTRCFLGLPWVNRHWEVLLAVGKPAVAAVESRGVRAAAAAAGVRPFQGEPGREAPR